MKLIDHFAQIKMKSDWKTQYIRYRIGRLKHQYWLWNRKRSKDVLIDSYDYSILQNCKEGNTAFFASSAYYLKDIFPEITVIEQHPVVATFYPGVYICPDRSKLADVVPHKFDNFAMVNHRGEMWTTVDGLTEHLHNYTKIMNPGCRVFYSFRDTQMHVNRLTNNLEDHFLDWAKSLKEKLGLTLVWHSIDMPKKVPDSNGCYNSLENPDTTNGNLKFWFVYGDEPWEIV